MGYRKSRDIQDTPKNPTVSVVHNKVFASIQTEQNRGRSDSRGILSLSDSR
jgi:hypothetical protein